MHPNCITEQILPTHSPLVSAPGRHFFIGISCQAGQLEFRGSSLAAPHQLTDQLYAAPWMMVERRIRELCFRPLHTPAARYQHGYLN